VIYFVNIMWFPTKYLDLLYTKPYVYSGKRRLEMTSTEKEFDDCKRHALKANTSIMRSPCYDTKYLF